MPGRNRLKQEKAGHRAAKRQEKESPTPPRASDVLIFKPRFLLKQVLPTLLQTNRRRALLKMLLWKQKKHDFEAGLSLVQTFLYCYIFTPPIQSFLESVPGRNIDHALSHTRLDSHEIITSELFLHQTMLTDFPNSEPLKSIPWLLMVSIKSISTQAWSFACFIKLYNHKYLDFDMAQPPKQTKL